MTACAFFGFVPERTERRKGVHGVAVAVNHLPSTVKQREAVKVVLCLNRPVTAVIVLKVPAVNQITVVSAIAVCDLAYIGPVISACAIVIIEPLVKQMILVRCFGIVKSVIALAVPEIFPNGGFKALTVGGASAA
jgi:hypothetical protein